MRQVRLPNLLPANMAQHSLRQDGPHRLICASSFPQCKATLIITKNRPEERLLMRLACGCRPSLAACRCLFPRHKPEFAPSTLALLLYQKKTAFRLSFSLSMQHARSNFAITIILQLVGISNAEGRVDNFANLLQLTFLQLTELTMKLSSALSVPASSAVEAAATCVHSDIHIPIITLNRPWIILERRFIFLFHTWWEGSVNYLGRTKLSTLLL